MLATVVLATTVTAAPNIKVMVARLMMVMVGLDTKDMVVRSMMVMVVLNMMGTAALNTKAMAERHMMATVALHTKVMVALAMTAMVALVTQGTVAEKTVQKFANSPMEIVLAVATLLGGIVAIWFLWEKYISSESPDKEVNNSWWESSDLKNDLEQKGYTFRWSNSDKLQERFSKGYEVIFEKSFLKKSRLVNKSGQVLIGKKNT